MSETETLIHRRKSALALTLALGSVLSLSGCAFYKNETGVANRWRDPGIAAFEPGRTTRAEVIEALGPPSQLINLTDGIVLYYLNEYGTGDGYVFIFINFLTQRTVFDRAIFFFDQDGVLTEYALSEEVNPRPASDGS